MPNQPLPEHLTKVSYILDKTDKPKLEAAAKKEGCSMSEVITRALRKYLTKSPAKATKRAVR